MEDEYKEVIRLLEDFRDSIIVPEPPPLQLE